MKGSRKIFIANVRDEDVDRLCSVALRHPARNSEALFFLSPVSPRLLELTSQQDKYRSWFVDDSVVSDGTVYMATPCDPLFFVLPYLQEGSSNGAKFSPLDQMLIDEQWPDTQKLSGMCSHSQLLNIADAKGTDPVCYKYNEEKTLEWLKLKIKRISEALEERGVTVAGACIREKAKDMFTQDQREKYACGLVCDYLPRKLADTLRKQWGVEDITAVKKHKASEPVQESKAKKARVEAEDDYSKSNGNAKDNTKAKEKSLNTKQKALVKASSGSKNIMAFFGKKSK